MKADCASAVDTWRCVRRKLLLTCSVGISTGESTLFFASGRLIRYLTQIQGESGHCAAVRRITATAW